MSKNARFPTNNPHNIQQVMRNSEQNCGPRCDIHIFSLKAIHKDKRPNLNANSTMCRGKFFKNKKNKLKCACYEGPALNKDRCYATPTFILSSERIEYVQSTKEFIRDHEKRVKEYEEQLEDLYVPKPRTKTMHCNVCRLNYEDYLEHIKSSPHKANIRRCTFNNYILDLQDQFKDLHPKDILPQNDTGTHTQSDSDVEIVAVSGRKRIKTSLDAPNGNQYPINYSQYYQQFENNMNQPFLYQNYPYFNSRPSTLEILGNCRDIWSTYAPFQSPFNPMGLGSAYPMMPAQMGLPMFCMPMNQMQMGMFQQRLF